MARIILFDRQHNRFLGPAHSILTSSTRHKEGTWYWDPAGPPSDLPAGLGPEREGILSAAPGGCETVLVGAGGGLGGANACIIRCSCVQGDPVSGSRDVALDQVSLYVELNVAYPLTGEDKGAVPENEAQVRGEMEPHSYISIARSNMLMYPADSQQRVMGLLWHNSACIGSDPLK